MDVYDMNGDNNFMRLLVTVNLSDWTGPPS